MQERARCQGQCCAKLTEACLLALGGVNDILITNEIVSEEKIEALRQLLQGATGTDLFDSTVYYLSRLPAKIDPIEAGAVVVMALTLSFLASILPARRAARLDPVEVLRYE